MNFDRVRSFFFPKLSKRFFLRLFLLAMVTWLIFNYLLVPLRIHGHSMEPTYKNGTFALCYRLQYALSLPERGDIVTIRFAGKNVMLLKRVVGLPDDTISFQDGQLYVNNRQVDETYVTHFSRWNLPERKVKPGFVYVVGDNRGTAMERHKFGQVSSKRIIGGVWP